MYTINGTDIRHAIRGATILGGGGGGAVMAGNDGLDQYKRVHGITDDADVECQVIDVDEMDAGGYAASTCALGAPTKIAKVEIAPFIVGAFDHLCEYAARKNKEIMYSMAIEAGGHSTVVPIFVAMEKGIPYVDCDGTGRAVPALDTLLFHINGLQTSPYTLSDNRGNRLTITMQNARDARTGEEIARNTCMAFGMMAGISGWICKKNDILNNLPTGTLSKAIKIGKALEKEKESGGNDYMGALQKAGITCRELGRGQLTKVHTEAASGFDRGYAEVTARDGSKKWITRFLNENLAVEECIGDDTATMMTVPDIICYINAATGEPLSNADIIDENGNPAVPAGEDLIVGLVKVDEKWWNNDIRYLQKCWSYYFNILGKPGQEIIPF